MVEARMVGLELGIMEFGTVPLDLISRTCCFDYRRDRAFSSLAVLQSKNRLVEIFVSLLRWHVSRLLSVSFSSEDIATLIMFFAVWDIDQLLLSLSTPTFVSPTVFPISIQKRQRYPEMITYRFQSLASFPAFSTNFSASPILLCKICLTSSYAPLRIPSASSPLFWATSCNFTNCGTISPPPGIILA